MIGLVAWLKVLREQSTCDWVVHEDQTALVLANPEANRIQIGLWQHDDKPARQAMPFLAYPPELWWWPRVWESVSIIPTAVVLSAEYGSPLQLILPTDVPKALQAMNAALPPEALWLCAPYSAHYSKGHPDSECPPRRPVEQETDLDMAAAAWIPNIPLHTGALWWAKSLRLSPSAA